MNRNFKCRCLRIIYGLMMTPHHVVVLAACMLILAVAVLFGRIPIEAVLVAEILIVLILMRLVAPTRLTECFSLYPIPFCSWRVIAQHRPAKGKSCNDILRALTKEATTLPDRIPQGRYKVITHDTVLQRIAAADELQLIKSTLLGQDNLMSLHTLMRSANCHRCRRKKSCRYLPMIQTCRPFYLVEFEKKDTPS